MLEHSLQRLHNRGITPSCGSAASSVMKISLALGGKSWAGGGGGRVVSRGGAYRFCQMCAHANDCMSDNVQSQPLMSEPPDSMSLFIPGHF